MSFSFRKARPEDSDILLRWRNDPLTRAQSLNGDPVRPEEHAAWFTSSLAREDRRILIAEGDGAPVGMVRFDRTGDAWELSWSIAPECRGKGWGTQLVREAALLEKGTLVARIKRQNAASESIARAAGFEFLQEKDGVGYWRRAGT